MDPARRGCSPGPTPMFPRHWLSSEETTTRLLPSFICLPAFEMYVKRIIQYGLCSIQLVLFNITLVSQTLLWIVVILSFSLLCSTPLFEYTNFISFLSSVDGWDVFSLWLFLNTHVKDILVPVLQRTLNILFCYQPGVELLVIWHTYDQCK